MHMDTDAFSSASLAKTWSTQEVGVTISVVSSPFFVLVSPSSLSSAAARRLALVTHLHEEKLVGREQILVTHLHGENGSRDPINQEKLVGREQGPRDPLT